MSPLTDDVATTSTPAKPCAAAAGLIYISRQASLTKDAAAASAGAYTTSQPVSFRPQARRAARQQRHQPACANTWARHAADDLRITSAHSITGTEIRCQRCVFSSFVIHAKKDIDDRQRLNYCTPSSLSCVDELSATAWPPRILPLAITFAAHCQKKRLAASRLMIAPPTSSIISGPGTLSKRPEAGFRRAYERARVLTRRARAQLRVVRPADYLFHFANK